MGKRLKILFTDFYPGFRAERNFYYQWLTQHGYEAEISDKPDYVFFSAFGDEHLRYNDCVKIFVTGECQTPDFNLCDYAIGFDYLDFGDRYLRFPLYFTYNPIAYEKMLQKHLQTDEEIATRKAFCSFVYSNGRATSEREAFFRALDSVRHVDSGGKLLNNIGGPVEDKIAFEQQHRFAIAFENTQYPGYSTEKIVEAFAAGGIPIYYGDPEIARVFNPCAFINFNDFNSIEEVVKRVVEIDNDPALYKQYVQAPALLDPQLRDEAMADMDAFLTHIFEQDKESAKRYSRNYWGVRIVQERKRQVNAYHRSWYYRLIQLYMQTIYPLARKNQHLWRITQQLMKLTSPSAKQT